MFISPDHGDPGDQPPRRHQQAAGDAGHTVRQVLRPAPVKMVDNGLEDDQNNDVGDDLDVSKDVYVDILLFSPLVHLTYKVRTLFNPLIRGS